MAFAPVPAPTVVKSESPEWLPSAPVPLVVPVAPSAPADVALSVFGADSFRPSSGAKSDPKSVPTSDVESDADAPLSGCTSRPENRSSAELGAGVDCTVPRSITRLLTLPKAGWLNGEFEA